MFSKVSSAVLALALMAQTVTAHAAGTSDQGAADLKKQVESALTKPAAPPAPGTAAVASPFDEGLTVTGAVEVTPKGSYYEVKLPGAAYMGPQGLKFDLGTITMNVTPGDSGEYTSALSLPTTTKVFDASNQPIADVTLGTQHFTGTWWPALDAFTKIDADYQNVQIKSATPNEFDVSVADMRSTLDLTKNADDTWSGPNKFSASDIKLNFTPHGGGNLAIGSITTSAVSDKMNLKARKDLQDKLLAQMQAQAAPGQTPEQKSAAMSGMMQNVQGFIDSVSSSFEADAIHIHANGEATPAQAAQPGIPARPATPATPFDATLAKLSSGFDLKGLQQEKGSTSLKMHAEGLTVAGVDAVTAGLIPTETNFEIYFDGLPMKALGQQFADVFSDAIMNAAQANAVPGAGAASAQLQSQHKLQMEVMGLMATLPQALAAAGSSVSIRDTHTNAPDLQSTLDGQIHASATSPLHAEGNMTLTLTGVDELILKLQALSQQANANPKYAGYATMLSMVQMQAQGEKGADGKSLRKFKFELTPQGQALLNGQPVGGHMAPAAMPPGMTAPAPGATPPAGTPAKP